MSSYIQSHVHFSAMQKAIKFMLQTDRDFVSRLKYKFEREMHIDIGPNPTTEELSYMLILHAVRGQIACVTAQYSHHLEEGEDINDVISDETDVLMKEIKACKNAPFHEGAPVHIMLRSYIYQCETFHLEDVLINNDTAERAVAIVEIMEWVDYYLLDKLVKKMMSRDEGEYWSLDERDLTESDESPIMIIGRR